MTTNLDQFPERLVVFRRWRPSTSLASGPTFAAEEQRPGDRPTCAEERAYVRADVAAEQTAAALRGEAHEVAALRAEVEALRSGEFVRTATAERNAYRKALEKVVALMVAGEDWEPWEAKEVAKAALAAKGVG